MKNMKHRNKFDILNVILTQCKTPQRKTELMYKGNLSFAMIENYIQELTERNLIEQRNDLHYVLTEHGKDFLSGLQLLLDLWRGMKLETARELNFPSFHVQTQHGERSL